MLSEPAAALRAIASAGFVGSLLLLGVIDFRTRRLPDRIVIPTLWAGLVLNAGYGAFATPAQAILGAAGGYLALWSLAFAYRLRRSGAAFGRGDFKLAAMIGAWLGMQALPAVLLAAFVSGTCAVLPQLLLGRARLDQAVPFGPALAIGGLLVLALGPSLDGLLPF